MKTVTQKDFQNLYKSPGYEQTQEMRRTLAGLPYQKNPERVPVIRRRRVALILAAVMVLMGVAAVATGFLNHTLVSWDARPVESAEPSTGLSDEEWLSVSNLLETCPKDEIMVAFKKDGSDLMLNDPGSQVSSEEELLQVLDAAGYPHPEKLIPEGWTFRSATVSSQNTPEGENELIEESESADGKYVIRRYKIDNQHRVVTGYLINLEKGGKEGRISSGATAKESILLLSVAYPADGEVHAEKLAVPGMEDALFSDYKDFSCLIMYRPLEKPLQINGDLYGQTELGPQVETIDYELITCDNLNPEEVISLFSAAK